MATPVLIPVSEYLKTSYRPDRDYIDGEVKERNLGETPHSTVQSFMVGIFLVNRKDWKVRAFTEQRVQVSESNYRIPDVCVVRMGAPQGPIVRSAPLICIEVLSPEDSRADIQPRVTDYLAMGVENIWILDPVRRIAWSVDKSGFHEIQNGELAVAETPIRIALSEIYTELDELAAGR